MKPLTDFAWLAGIIEGEGSILLRGTKSYPQIRTAPFVKVAMIDHDIIERCRDVAGFGTICSSTLKSGNTIYQWQAGRRDLVPGLLMTLYSWMGTRRRHQIEVVLAGWEPYGYKSRSVRRPDRATVIG